MPSLLTRPEAETLRDAEACRQRAMDTISIGGDLSALAFDLEAAASQYAKAAADLRLRIAQEGR